MTAFFVLLGTFSLFAFLFLVPFVIEPAFTTIFMQFNTVPAQCVTVEVESHKGVSNCSWTSCREGCTKEMYECTQIRVNYKVHRIENGTLEELEGPAEGLVEEQRHGVPPERAELHEALDVASERFERALREYDYLDAAGTAGGGPVLLPEGEDGTVSDLYSDLGAISQTMGNESEWFFSGARLYPNVKGCGYPPMLNCTIWSKKYKDIGSNFSCFYSMVDPSLVISDLDLWQNKLNLVYAMAIPIPSFIISVIYLTFAYFLIYNEDEETAPLDKNAEDMADEDPQPPDDGEGEDEEEIQMDVDEVTKGGEGEDEEAVSTGSEPLTTPNSDMVSSFGHQLKVQMADEMSRESFMDAGFMSQSGSFQG